MKIKILLLSLFLLIPISNLLAGEKIELKDQKDRTSYSLGINVVQTLKNQSMDMNVEAFIQGIRDAFSEGEKLMTDQEVNETLKELQTRLTAKRNEQLKEIGDKNRKEGENFLEANKEKEGVITLPSGLQYKVLKEGDGDKPTYHDTVTVNYRGTLVDGTEFDSSYKRGQPAVFRVSGVIPGLSEALQLMTPGSKWQVFIPSDLAYGERGAGRIIEPNETLIFEVELISFESGMKFHTDEMQP